MSALFEVNSFVNKFLTLCNNGESANLNLKCHDGKIVIDLQLHLQPIPPPPYAYRPQSSPPPRVHPSPSRLRRSARRAQSRAANNASKAQTEQVSADCSKTEDQTIISAEQAAKDATENEDVVTIRQVDQSPAEQAVDCVPAKQAVLPTPQTPPHHEKQQISTSKQELLGDGDKNSSNQQLILICNFCNKEFENEEELKDHTSIEHNSGRLRFKTKVKEFSS